MSSTWKVAERLREVMTKNPRKERPKQRKQGCQKDPARTHSGRPKRTKKGRASDEAPEPTSKDVQSAAADHDDDDDDLQIIAFSSSLAAPNVLYIERRVMIFMSQISALLPSCNFKAATRHWEDRRLLGIRRSLRCTRVLNLLAVQVQCSIK